ncbi:stage V sporulation protein AA [Paenibacillus radicis (ex Gao et al. 2016)]|uniref:Stage V sporulation protein AA n=1 Tax=Paenibacillus radicis (ex Gao et al. 2016) TaxID=1737354 RepID=A0A917LU70_9BACL|nr:stage V sporulation protein AA [Paenibacillus radicis (ex Gao et al. 2016)]GGG57195.1 stage V sporulation protein AA [Paenibacillus radicis (ex Gao et al. 2016)]
MDVPRQSALYLRLKKRITIRPRHKVTLGQVARLLAANDEQEQRLADLVLYRHAKADGNRVVIDLLQIVKAIRLAEPSLTVEAYGDPQVLIMVSEKPVKPRIIVLLFAWLLLFFGAGLAIMNFHTDVSMREVHIRIVELITGEKTEHPLWFQIPYSLGIGLGMILFFNHLFRKRFNEEPNPLEVELYTYQENVNAYVIADEMRKKNSSSQGHAGDDN